ncbi:hypothetical protein D9M68_920840 [compost metagenome]
MRSTAVPSATPSPVSKPMVAAGYCATCVICSGALRSTTRATADSGVGSPEPVRICSAFRASMEAARSVRASSTTRYWLVSVKMVETMRWPKAL